MTHPLFQTISLLDRLPTHFPDFFPDFARLCQNQCEAALSSEELALKVAVQIGVDVAAIEERLLRLKNYALSLRSGSDIFSFLQIVGSDDFGALIDLGVAHFHDEKQYPDHPSQVLAEGLSVICRHLAGRCVDEILVAIAANDASFDQINQVYGLTLNDAEFLDLCTYNAARWQTVMQIFCDQRESTLGFETALQLMIAWILERPDLLEAYSHLGQEYGDKIFRLSYGLKPKALTGPHRTALHKLLVAGWQRATPAIVDLIAFDEMRCQQLLQDPRPMVRGAAAMIGIEREYISPAPQWRDAITELLTFDLRPVHSQRAERALRLVDQNS